MVAEVARVEDCIFVDLPCQEAGSQGAEGNEADLKFLKEGQQFVLRLAPEERVFTLQRCDRLHDMCLANRPRTGVRETEVLHLAFRDQALHRACDLLDGHLGIHTMLVEQVDVIGAEPLQGSFGNGLDVLGRLFVPGPRAPVWSRC